jgi:hypothetical protein
MGKFLGGTAAGFAAAFLISAAQPALAEDAALKLLTDQLKLQGFECKNAQSATRDDAASKPDEVVWILKCDGASYRMRVIPDMAAQVEKLQSD